MSSRAVQRLVAAALALVLAPAVVVAAQVPSAPTPEVARAIALAYLAEHTAVLGLTAADIADVAVTDVVPTRHDGVTHVYLRQRLQGLEIDGAELGIHVDRRGRVFHVAGGFVRAAAALAARLPSFPRLAPEEAVDAAARALGLGRVDRLDLVGAGAGGDRFVEFANEALSEDPIPVRLRWLRRGDGTLRRAWSVVINDAAGPDWWQAWVDAESGALLDAANWTADSTYRVFASPKESPYDGDRTDEVDPHDLTASPFGWHDLDGTPGHETTLTSGNNVNACTDIDANNACDPGSQPDGGGGLVFQPPLDLATQQPADYRDAAVVNLYYWNNLMHDISYQYGFDEPAGNFQENNYGNGGAGSDAVEAQAQDGSGVNNANFATPADGGNPRMQMYVWTNPFSQFVTVNAPPPIADSYVANPSNNGGTGNGLTADMVVVADATPPTTDACEPVTNDLTGKIALIVWSEGICNSSVFVANAANAGAVAAVIVDNQDLPLTNFGGSALIPSVAVGLADGTLILDTLIGGTTVNATLEDNPDGQINRDSDLDNGIIAHEYGHGISNRLTGGPAAASCLNNAEQAGEGWSDWMSLFLHADPTDTATTPRSVGSYAAFDDPVDGRGIRRFVYTTDNAVNPLTYSDLAANPEVHDIGEVWAVTLWEMYWNLVAIYGYDPDLYHGAGGNNLAFQLTIDGMKLQPCRPGFVDARNGILAADLAANDGDNECAIWAAFAERGMGANASQGSNLVVGDEVENFDLPAACVDVIFVNSFGPRWQELWSATQP
jgi:hypothetical protein